MPKFEVDVYWGGGGDTDEVATYLVHAPNAQRAADEALSNAQQQLNCTVRLIRFPNTVEEIDYDAVLHG